MNDWGGAQWVMAALIVVTLQINLVGFFIQTRPLSKRVQWIGMKVFDAVVLVSILIWGGFF